MSLVAVEGSTGVKPTVFVYFYYCIECCSIMDHIMISSVLGKLKCNGLFHIFQLLNCQELVLPVCVCSLYSVT